VTTIDAHPLLTEQLGRVRTTWPGGGWEWDGRLGCALSTVDKPQEARAREALSAVLSSNWTAGQLAQAPAVIQALCAHVGGLRGDQRVFAAELADGTIAYCFWWPWGSGANFSARIGAVGRGGDSLSAVVRSALGTE
jgi:hypothetical protein